MPEQVQRIWSLVMYQYNSIFDQLECTPDQLKNDVEMVVKKHADNYELNWAIPSEPYLTPKGDLTNILTSAISEITGVNPEAQQLEEHQMVVIAKICKQVVEFGPINASIHKINEHVNIADTKAKEIYKLSLIKILCG